jgi:hypothetical protein
MLWIQLSQESLICSKLVEVDCRLLIGIRGSQLLGGLAELSSTGVNLKHSENLSASTDSSPCTLIKVFHQQFNAYDHYQFLSKMISRCGDTVGHETV